MSVQTIQYEQNGVVLFTIDVPEGTPQERIDQMIAELLSTEPTQHQRDIEIFKNRAETKGEMLALIAANNRAMLSTEDLSTIMSLEAVKDVIFTIDSLSYELCISKINAIDNIAISTELKDSWKNTILGYMFK